MNPTSFAFLVLAVSFGGAIAYCGDLLGSHIGKKRISLLGLRPRHTARVATIGMGMVIPLATLALTLAASEPIRQWFVNGPALIKQRDDLQTERKRLSTNNQELVALNTEKKNELVRLEKSKVKIQKDYDQAEAKLKSQTSKLQALSSRYSTLLVKSSGLSSRLAELKLRLSSTLKSIASVKSQYDKVNRQMGTLNAVYGSLRTSYGQLRTQNDEYQSQNSKLDKLNRDLEAQGAKLEVEARKLQDQIKALEAVQESVNASLESSRRELSLAQEAAQNFKLSYTYSRTESMIYQIREEVARLPIPRGIGAVRAQEALNQLLKLCEVRALERGAAAQSGWGIASLRIPEQRPDILEQIRANPDEIVILANAVQNSFRGEPLLVDVTIQENPLIYRKGQVIVSGLIDCGRPREDLAQQVKDFLSGPLSAQVRKDRMIPQQGPNATVGEVTFDQFSELLQKLANKGRKQVTLVAAAMEDTRAAGPLHLNFLIQ